MMNHAYESTDGAPLICQFALVMEEVVVVVEEEGGKKKVETMHGGGEKNLPGSGPSISQ